MSEWKPLTLEELRKMDGKPAYWLDDDSYGIISVESYGRWADVPFFRGRKNGVNFEYNIKSRRIEVYAVEPPRLDRSAWEPCAKCCDEPDNETMRIYFPSNWDGGIGFEYEEALFCPRCGRPLTDSAWDMLERRLAGHEHQ